MGSRGSSGKGSEPVQTGFRQLQFIFNPWESGHTTCTVVTVDYRGAHRAVHRIGSINLDLGRQALVGLAASEVAALLCVHLHEWMSEHRPTLPQGRQAPGAPGGATGAVVGVPGQLSLDLALRD